MLTMKKMNSAAGVFVLILIGIFAVGYFIGSGIGGIFTQSIITGDSRYLFLLYRPADEYLLMLQKLNSENRLLRLSGYYSLADYNKIDHQFLIERYKQEDSIPVKRTIVWLLGFAGNVDTVTDFFSHMYRDSPHNIKKEILTSMKRCCSEDYKGFVKAQKVSAKLLESIN